MIPYKPPTDRQQMLQDITKHPRILKLEDWPKENQMKAHRETLDVGFLQLLAEQVVKINWDKL